MERFVFLLIIIIVAAAAVGDEMMMKTLLWCCWLFGDNNIQYVKSSPTFGRLQMIQTHHLLVPKYNLDIIT